MRPANGSIVSTPLRKWFEPLGTGGCYRPIGITSDQLKAMAIASRVGQVMTKCRDRAWRRSLVIWFASSFVQIHR